MRFPTQHMLADLPPILSDHPEWIVAGAIVLIFLFIYGFKDLLKFSFIRAWAISGVCFAESIRRRVLWIIPLAIVGVIIVAQLQHPNDEQDAIRQTTKFCLFATGLVVTITAIILASTNLPKEIDTRVIYTIVTKPTTRLEIVIGKIIGFARVSATILLIMGLFTLCYMQVRAWSLASAIDQRIKDGNADASTLSTLVHYRDSGLLNAHVYSQAEDMQILSREPQPGDNKRWMFGGEGTFIVPFHVERADLISASDPTQTPGLNGIDIVAYIGFAASQFGEQKKAGSDVDSMYYVAAPHATTKPIPAQPQLTAPPTVTFDILDQNETSLIASTVINGGKPTELFDPNPGHQSAPIVAHIPPEAVESLLKTPIIYVQVRGNTPNVEYSATLQPVLLAVPPLTQGAHVITPVRNPKDPTRVVAPYFRTSAGTYGLQLRGGSTGKTPFAIYRFRGTQTAIDAAGNVPFELRVGIERGASNDDPDAATLVEATVINHPDFKRPELDRVTKVSISPETTRTAFFTVPASAVEGGNFDVLIRCKSDGQFVGVQSSSLNLIVSDHSFALNLAKSLLVLWLMSLLVVIVSIFCSTFLSWPIAIVLTVLILLGRWGVMQLGDATAPGIGNMVATDMGLVRDPSKAKVVSDTVEALAKMLNLLAKVLPDITRFSALEDIERGVYLPMSRLTDSLVVIGAFGLPMMVMAYVFLRNKEVAP